MEEVKFRKDEVIDRERRDCCFTWSEHDGSHDHGMYFFECSESTEYRQWIVNRTLYRTLSSFSRLEWEESLLFASSDC